MSDLTDIYAKIQLINTLDLQQNLRIDTIEIDLEKKTYIDTQDNALQTQITANNVIDSLQDVRISTLENNLISKNYIDSQDTNLQNQINVINNLDITQNTRISLLETDSVKKTYVDNQDINLQTQINATNTTLNNLSVLLNTDATNLQNNINSISTLLNSDFSGVQTQINNINSIDITQNTRLTNLENDEVKKTYVDNQDNLLQTQINNINATNSTQNTQLTNLQNTKLNSLASGQNILVSNSAPNQSVGLTGIIPIQNGGLGMNIAPSLGSMLIGNNTAGYDLKTFQVTPNLTFNSNFPNQTMLDTAQDIQIISIPTFQNVISGEPSISTHLTTKNYVDTNQTFIQQQINQITTINGVQTTQINNNYGLMSNPYSNVSLLLTTNVLNTQVTSLIKDSIYSINGDVQGNVLIDNSNHNNPKIAINWTPSFNSVYLSNVPVNASDATNKQYVDNLVLTTNTTQDVTIIVQLQSLAQTGGNIIISGTATNPIINTIQPILTTSIPTFQNVVTTDPTANQHVATKIYVDTVNVTQNTNITALQNYNTTQDVTISSKLQSLAQTGGNIIISGTATNPIIKYYTTNTNDKHTNISKRGYNRPNNKPTRSN